MDTQSNPSVAAEIDGDFVIAWHSMNEDGSNYGVFARSFDSGGVAIGLELAVTTYTANAQGFPAVAAAPDRGFVVAWSSLQQDGDGDGVFAQRLVQLAVLDIDGDGAVGALTDGLLVLRFMFGFTGTTLTNGAVGPACTRCNAALIEPYLQGLV